MKWTAVALPALLALTACIDGAGPRPRPGGDGDTLPTATAPALLWYELQPRVVTQGVLDTVRITAAVSGDPDVVQVVARSSDVITLTRGAGGIYSGKLAPATLLFGYHTGDLHNSVGAIVLRKPNHEVQYGFLVDVKDATIPTVDVVPLANGIQWTTHVVNIRYDSIFAGRAVPAAPLKTFYSLLPDDFNFVAVIEQVQSPRDPSLLVVRNAVRGIGEAIFDDGRAYGSNATLEAVIDYPFDVAYDPAETSNIHALAHRWMNYLRPSSLASGRPHWPLSDLANGIMGWEDPITHTAASFPFEVNAQPNGTYVLRFTGVARTFNDLELYLMGLIPSDSVRPHVVFQNQNQREQFKNQGVLQGPVDSVTIAQIVSAEGARLPAASVAPRQFRMATIVLSRGGVLSRTEMSFFEEVAKRGEATSPLPYFNQTGSGTTLPFILATNGRATLTTSVRQPE